MQDVTDATVLSIQVKNKLRSGLILKEQENPDATKLLKRELVRALENSSDKENTVLSSGLYLSSPFESAERLGNKTANSKNVQVKYQQADPRFKKDSLNDFSKKAIDMAKKSGELFHFEIDKSQNIAHGFYAIKVSANMLSEYGNIASDIDGDGYDSFGYKMPNWNQGEIHSGFYISLDLNEDITALHAQILINILVQLVIGVVLILLFATILKNSTSYSINKIKTGLDTFFKFLNRESNNCDTIEVTTSDDLGKMATSINENIIKTQKGIQEDTALISEAESVIDKVKHGVFRDNINSNTSNQSLNNFKNSVNDMILATKTHFESMNNILEKYAKYDYRDKLNLQGIEKDSVFELVASDINKLRDAITEMLVENKKNGLTLDKSSDILLKNVETLNNNSTVAAASLEETAAALEELTSNVSSNNSNVQEMSNLASKVTKSANEGQSLASKTTEAMDEINNEVNAINEAISVIDQIAFQTNILSLNAAVEAATAGEAGKGFAVVAGEVRNLAARSAEAASEIKSLVENATAKANEGKNIADSMIKGYEDLNTNISKTIDLIGNVESASKEQEVGIVQINDAVNSLDRQTQENASVASQTNNIAIQTDRISKVVVDSTDQKEFIGKDSVVADKIEDSAITKPTPQAKPVAKKQTSVKTQAAVEKPKPIVSQTADDEWESF